MELNRISFVLYKTCNTPLGLYNTRNELVLSAMLHTPRLRQNGNFIEGALRLLLKLSAIAILNTDHPQLTH